MSNYQNPYETAGYDQKPKKGWFGRNWFWFLPTVILLPLLCCCGGLGALIHLGVGVMFDTPPYQDTIAIVEQDQTIQQEIGTPIDWPEGFMDLVNIENQGGTIDLSSTNGYMLYTARLPVSGPNGSGTLRIEAESVDGVTWTYMVREFEIDSTGELIDLMPPDPNSP